MPNNFSGLSLIVHLFVIVFGKLKNFIFGTKEKSAFQTYERHGGWFHNRLSNTIMSVFILCSVAFYMLILGFIAIRTGLQLGADEVQVIFVKSILLALFASLDHDVIMIILSLLEVGLGFAILITVDFEKFISRYFAPIELDFSKTLDKMFNSIKSKASKITSGMTNRVTKPGIAEAVYIIVLVFYLFSMPQVGVAQAQVLEPGFETAEVANGFSIPTTIAFAPDGRVFVGEKGGTIHVIKNDVLLPEPLVTLTDINTFGDRGLLGMAIDPDFENNGYIYLSYTFENSPGSNFAGPKTGRIVRLTVIGDVASEASKLVLVGSVGGTPTLPSCEDYAVTDDCIASDSSSHSVGGLQFGPDNKLYASTGDGADFVTEDSRALRAQNLDSLAGKVLRLNTDGTAPVDNPYYNGDANSNRSKVYALGFRNMYRINFHPVGGQLFGGDVGWSSWEEVNHIQAGENHGWPCIEGNSTTSYNCAPSSAPTGPIYTYPHNSTGAGSITLGSFPSNSAYPAEYNDTLFIGDYAQSWIKLLNLDGDGGFLSVDDFWLDNIWPVDFKTAPDGNVYYLDVVMGNLNKITHTSGNRTPVVIADASPNSGLSPLRVFFSSAGTYDPDFDTITYYWNFGDGNTSTLENPSHTYRSDGTFDAVLTVTDAFGASDSETLSIVVGDQAPQAVILEPPSGSLYTPFEVISFSGVGTDPEDGDIPASGFHWEIILHHNVHVHTLQEFDGVKSGYFIADDHNATDVYTEVILTVTDSAGLSDTRSINLYLDSGAGSGNLISNPSLEVEGTIAGQPLDWYQGWFGSLNPIFTYPSAGIVGDKSVTLEVTEYTSGNAKWFFSPVFVTPGEDYNFSHEYISNVTTRLVAQYGFANGTYQYELLDLLASSAVPAVTDYTITIPANVQTLSIFHELDSVGVLTTDAFNLTLAGTVNDTEAPTVAIISPEDGDIVSGVVPVDVIANDNVAVAGVHFHVDGVQIGAHDTEAPYQFAFDTSAFPDGAHELSVYAHDAVGNKSSTSSIQVVIDNSTTTNVNLIVNGSFETVVDNAPVGWTPVHWGTHVSAFTFPVVGFDGGNAAGLEITDYQFGDTGDSRWQFDDVTVTPGTEYTYSEYYLSNSISDIVGRYTLSNGSYHYFGLIKEIPSVSQWTYHEATFTPPADAVSVSLLHLISSEATLSIDETKLYVSGTSTPSETEPPVVSISSPTEGQTISGIQTINADATDNVGVVGVYFAINGAPFGDEDFVAPYTVDLDTTLHPDGDYVLKATAHDAVGNNSATTINVTIDNSGATSTPDETAPTTSILSPTEGSLVSGLISITTDTTDDIAVASANLLVDGGVLFTDTLAPYNFSLDTNTLSNGIHTLQSEAYDTSGNIGTSTIISIDVQNTVATTTTNLILNPSFEIETIPGTPDNWRQGGWGTNDRSHTFPATGETGKGAKVEITSFSSGDAKWYFDDVTVIPDTAYTFSNSYNSTLSSEIVIRYTLDDASTQYVFVTSLPSTGGTWSAFQDTITTPANAASMTIFHVIGGVGELTVDEYSLSLETPIDDTTPPTVSITNPLDGATISGLTPIDIDATDNTAVASVSVYIDGILSDSDTTAPYGFTLNTNILPNGAHTLYAEAVDIAGNSAVSATINVVVDNGVITNLILNPSFEIETIPGTPDNWRQGGWGTNDRSHTFPATGETGKGAKVEITSFSSGDAKWYFDDVTVIPDTAYTFSNSYNSTLSSEIVIRYTLDDASTQYVFVTSLPSTGGTWSAFQDTITTPANAASMTIFHVIGGVGELTVDEYSLAL